MVRPIQIRLGTLDSQSNDVRDFGRASDLVNVDIDKTNEVSRRKGYIRRLSSQGAGPIRFLHSYGGICGRFYQYSAGGGLIKIDGTGGSGSLRNELDLDTNYPPDGVTPDPDEDVGTGGGNEENTETPGGTGEVSDSNGFVVSGPGVNRNRDGQEGDDDGIVEDETDPNWSFSFTAAISATNTATLTWGYSDPNGLGSTGYVEVYRVYGSGDPKTDGILVTRSSDLVGTYDDTVDEYSNDIKYAIYFFLEGVGTYGPYTETIAQVEVTQISDDFNRVTLVDATHPWINPPFATDYLARCQIVSGAFTNTGTSICGALWNESISSGTSIQFDITIGDITIVGSDPEMRLSFFGASDSSDNYIESQIYWAFGSTYWTAYKKVDGGSLTVIDTVIAAGVPSAGDIITYKWYSTNKIDLIIGSLPTMTIESANVPNIYSDTYGAIWLDDDASTTLTFNNVTTSQF